MAADRRGALTALVFAAGRASRLGTAAGAHKALLEFDGHSLLGWHALRLARAGVERMLVVTGHRADAVEAELARVRLESTLDVLSVFNARYREGSVLSLATGVAALPNANVPLLLMDADVLYADEILDRLLRSPHASCLLVDRDVERDDDDPVLVPIIGDRPADLVKGWRGRSDSIGESVGFFKIAAADRAALTAATASLVRNRDDALPYEEVIRALVTRGRLGHEDVTGIPWIEIDFPKDLERARSAVWPAILAANTASSDVS